MDIKTIMGIVLLVLLVGALMFLRIRNKRRGGSNRWQE